MTSELIHVRGVIASLDEPTQVKVKRYASALAHLVKSMGIEGQIALAPVVAEIDAKQRGES